MGPIRRKQANPQIQRPAPPATEKLAARASAPVSTEVRSGNSGKPLPPIRRIFLEKPAPACKEALEAIRRADMIILGPGDLYTSILPNLLVDGMTEAIAASRAEKVYVCNLMTKHGETDGYHASDFVRKVHH